MALQIVHGQFKHKLKANIFFRNGKMEHVWTPPIDLPPSPTHRMLMITWFSWGALVFLGSFPTMVSVAAHCVPGSGIIHGQALTLIASSAGIVQAAFNSFVIPRVAALITHSPHTLVASSVIPQQASPIQTR